MSSLQLNYQDQFGQELRHYCRNPRCRSKLKQPVENPHKAFCCRGCHGQFYRNRCVVCEKELPPGRSDRRFCRKRSCRNEHDRNPILFALAEPNPDLDTGFCDLTLKNPIKPGVKSGLEPDRAWRIIAGPALNPSTFHCATIPLSPEVVARLHRQHTQHYRDAALKALVLIGPTDPPINILGGFKFDDFSVPPFLVGAALEILADEVGAS